MSMNMMIRAIKSMEPASLDHGHIQGLTGAIAHFPNERLAKAAKEVLTQSLLIEEKKIEQMEVPDQLDFTRDCERPEFDGNYDNPGWQTILIH